MGDKQSIRRSERQQKRRNRTSDAQQSTSDGPTPLDIEEIVSPTITTLFGRENEGQPSQSASPLRTASRSSSADQNGASPQRQSNESSVRPIGLTTLITAIRELENRMVDRLKDEIKAEIAEIRSEIRSEFEKRFVTNSNSNLNENGSTMNASRIADDRSPSRTFTSNEYRKESQLHSSALSIQLNASTQPNDFERTVPAISPSTDRQIELTSPLINARIDRMNRNRNSFDSAPNERVLVSSASAPNERVLVSSASAPNERALVSSTSAPNERVLVSSASAPNERALVSSTSAPNERVLVSSASAPNERVLVSSTSAPNERVLVSSTSAPNESPRIVHLGS